MSLQALVTSLFLVDLSEQRRPICGESGSPGANRLRYLHGNALVDHLDCIGPHHKPYPRLVLYVCGSSIARTSFTILFHVLFRLEIEQLVQNLNLVARSLSGQFRQARMMMPSESTMDKVLDMKQMLLQSYEASNHLMSFEDTVLRQKRAGKPSDKNCAVMRQFVALFVPNFTADDPKNATKLDGADKTNQTEANPEVEAVSCDPKNMAPARLCKSSFNTTAPLYGVSLTSGEPVTIVQKFPDLLQQVVYETCE